MRLITRADGQQPPPVLAAVGLAKSYRGRTAVEAVGLAVRPGRIHGLLGPNGAGKTTTLRMLLGVVRPDRGRIEVAGRPISADVPRGRCGIAGFVESPNFYPYLTASRNLELLSAWDGPAAHRRVEELLELVGLAGQAQHRVRGFSTGMRQRLGLAAALISSPRVLIVDEPTTGLDPAGVRDLHTLLVELAAGGQSVVLSSHDLDEVEQLCTDVTVLRAGRVVFDGDMDQLRELAPQRRWHLRTADDRSAVSLLDQHPAVSLASSAPTGLALLAEVADLDAFVLALAAAGLAIRELRREQLPLESLFFRLTEDPAAAATAGQR